MYRETEIERKRGREIRRRNDRGNAHEEGRRGAAKTRQGEILFIVGDGVVDYDSRGHLGQSLN